MARRQITTSNYYTKDYIDENGDRVMEIHTPTSHTVIRSNKTHLVYTSDSEKIYDGPIEPIDQSYFDSLFDDLDLDIDSQMENLDRQLEALDKKLDEMDRHLISPTRLSTNNYHYNRRTYTPHTQNTYTRKTETQTGCFGGCLGCLVWFIIIIVVIGVIIAGLGHLGQFIIDLISSLF